MEFPSAKCTPLRWRVGEVSVVYTKTLKTVGWDGPSSHSAYSIRGVQETNHKLCFLEEAET